MTDVYISNFDMGEGGGGGGDMKYSPSQPIPLWLVYDFEVFEMHLIFWKGDG